MTCRIIQSLAEIGGSYQALLCDIWGCYHNGVAPYGAAVAALHVYRARGGIVILLTNAPRPASYVRQFLDSIGAPKDSYDGIMSSGAACQRAVASAHYGVRFHYVGPPRDLHMLTSLGLEDTALDRGHLELLGEVGNRFSRGAHIFLTSDECGLTNEGFAKIRKAGLRKNPLHVRILGDVTLGTTFGKAQDYAICLDAAELNFAGLYGFDPTMPPFVDALIFGNFDTRFLLLRRCRAVRPRYGPPEVADQLVLVEGLEQDVIGAEGRRIARLRPIDQAGLYQDRGRNLGLA